MKHESRRERAEFAAQLRVYSPKDPPILSTEAINDLCAVFHEDAKKRRRVIKALRTALSSSASDTRHRAVQDALSELEGDE